MALIQPPAWMQAGTYPARNDRLALTALLSYPGFAIDEATPMRIRQGVKPSYQNYQLKVRAAATPNMTVIVSAGFAFIDQHDVGGQGTYICVNDADVTLAVQPAGGAGQYRKDTVVASVYDQEYAGAVSEWRLEVIQGPYAASAGTTVRASLPSNAQVLADISIGPSQTSITTGNIVDARSYSVAAGGIVPVSSNTVPNRPHPGQMLYLTDTDRFLYGKSDGSSGELQKTPGAWTPWTPTWSTQTGVHLPSFGNAVVDCRYSKIGRTVLYYLHVVFGTTTNFGTGAVSSDNWTFSLPFAAAASGVSIGSAFAEPGHSSRATTAMAQVNTDLATMSFFISGPRIDGTVSTGLIDSVSPFTWGSGMRLEASGQYEAAA